MGDLATSLSLPFLLFSYFRKSLFILEVLLGQQKYKPLLFQDLPLFRMKLSDNSCEKGWTGRGADLSCKKGNKK